MAENINFTVDQIKNVKKYTFLDEHYLDRYETPDSEFDPTNYKRFDSNLQQALS